MGFIGLIDHLINTATKRARGILECVHRME